MNECDRSPDSPPCCPTRTDSDSQSAGWKLNQFRFGSDTAENEGVGVKSAMGLMCGINLAVEQVGTGILRPQQVHKHHVTVELVRFHDTLVRELSEGENFLGGS